MNRSEIFEDSYRHKGLRRALVKKLTEKGITNTQVLNAIGQVPRHLFLDNAFLEHAYQDKAFPIGEGQTISQPYTVARQTELLDVKAGDKVLEIGTGSGYQCCVLVAMGATVYSIEYNAVLYKRTSHFLNQLGYKAHLFWGDGSLGLPQYAPYNKILVTAGAPAVPDALLVQLAVNGCLVIPVGDSNTQKMLRITKLPDGSFQTEDFGDFRFVPLKGRQGWQDK